MATTSQNTGTTRVTIVLCAIVVLGTGLRAALYARGVSFWGDEACLLTNVIAKTPLQLITTRLDAAGPESTQAGPPLFLLAVRAAAVGLGPAPTDFVPSEYASRAVPFACSVLSLVLCAVAARCVLGPTHLASLSVALLAFSPPAVAQANNVKQYSGDLAVAAGLIALATGVGATRGSARGFLLVALVSSVMLWLSHTTAFVFGAISLGFLVTLTRPGLNRRVAWVVGNLIFLSSFIALYFLSVRVQTDDYLQHFWLEKFPPTSPMGWPVWTAENVWEFFNYFHSPVGIVLLPLMVIGFVALKRDGKIPLAIVLLGPVGLVFVAACLHQYPFGGTRLVLFTLPGLAILTGVGLQNILSWPMTKKFNATTSTRHVKTPGLVATGVVTLVILVGTGRALYEVLPVSYRSDIRPALTHALSRRLPDEPVVADARSYVVVRLYWPESNASTLLISKDLTPSPGACWLVTDLNSAGRERKIKRRLNDLHDRVDGSTLYIDRGGITVRLK